MMTCRELIEFLMAYLDGELPLAQRASFRLHLVLCGACRRYVQSYRETVALGRSAFADADAPVPAEVPEALVQAILEARDRV